MKEILNEKGQYNSYMYVLLYELIGCRVFD